MTNSGRRTPQEIVEDDSMMIEGVCIASSAILLEVVLLQVLQPFGLLGFGVAVLVVMVMIIPIYATGLAWVSTPILQRGWIRI